MLGKVEDGLYFQAAGDFFFVNQREETAANAQINAIRAELAGRLAEASYNAATMNLGALGPWRLPMDEAGARLVITD